MASTGSTMPSEEPRFPKLETEMKTENDIEDSVSESWPEVDDVVGFNSGFPTDPKTSEVKDRVIIYLLKKQLQDRDVVDDRFINACWHLMQSGIISLQSFERYLREEADAKGKEHNSIASFQQQVDNRNRFMSDFTIIKPLGVGGFGTVFLAKHNLDGKLYAVKQILFETGSMEDVLDNQVFREVQALAQMQHAGICRYHNVWVENGYHPIRQDGGASLCLPEHFEPEEMKSTSSAGDKVVYDYDLMGGTSLLLFDQPTNRKLQRTLYIQMEYCGEETMRDYININGKKNMSECLNLFSQVLASVYYIHNTGYIHRDLKPENVFVTPDQHVKVGDFGLAVKDKTGSRRAPSSPHQLRTAQVGSLSVGIGTRGYTAPECEVSGTYDNKADIYSLGIMLWEILSGGFETVRERQDELTKLLNGEPNPALFEADPEATELMLRMIQKDPAARPSIQEIIELPWHSRALSQSAPTGANDSVGNESDPTLAAEQQLMQLRRTLSETTFSPQRLASLRAELQEIEKILPKSNKEVIDCTQTKDDDKENQNKELIL